jgi:hypothetical protein
MRRPEMRDREIMAGRWELCDSSRQQPLLREVASHTTGNRMPAHDARESRVDRGHGGNRGEVVSRAIRLVVVGGKWLSELRRRLNNRKALGEVGLTTSSRNF